MPGSAVTPTFPRPTTRRLALGDGIGLDDLRPYPSLALPDNAFQKIQRALQQLGLWTQEVHRSRYSLKAREGQVLHTHTVGYATAFSLPLFQGEQVALPLATGLDEGDSLVVKRLCRAPTPAESSGEAAPDGRTPGPTAPGSEPS